MLVVSLSSIPPRFPRLFETLTTIMAQTVKPDRIIVYVPHSYRRFPSYDGAPPPVPEGVEIRRPAVDLGPATKVLFAARDFAAEEEAGEPVDILFCDDDIDYSPRWISSFLSARRGHPEGAIAARGFQISTLGFHGDRNAPQPRMVAMPRWLDLRYRSKRLYQQLALQRFGLLPSQKPGRRAVLFSGNVDIFEGIAGVMVRPSFFDEAAFDIPPVLWTVDDVWLSGCLARKGIPIWAFSAPNRYRMTTQQDIEPLFRATIEGADRDAANRLCAKHMMDKYGIWGGSSREHCSATPSPHRQSGRLETAMGAGSSGPGERLL